MTEFRLSLLLCVFVMHMGQLVTAGVLDSAKKPKSSRCITFPKTSYEDCLTDEEYPSPGKCKLLEDCPAALGRWQQERVLPKTCYFEKFDQYICCAVPLTAFALAGIPTAPHEFPFMAALGWNSSFDGSIYYRCGGTLISPSFVLTAAHCINFGGLMPTTVRLGGDNLTLSEGEDRKITQIFVHPDYENNTSYNDIALIELNRPASFYNALTWTRASLPEDNFTALGYGQIRFAGASSSQLLKVPLQLYSSEECQPHYQRDVLSEGLVASQMCAGDKNLVHDTCQGDSGGPLLMHHSYTWYVVGITSFGLGCGTGPPSIYTRVSSYLDWIEGIVNHAQIEQARIELSC